MATWSDGDTLIQLEEDEEYDFELAQRRMEAERAAREEEAFQRNTLNLDIPPLPNGKTHHLFISHCNDPPEEAEWAEQLVNTMERDFGLKCLWPKRDFTPGHDVGALIQSGIVSSVKVVFILSPASMESRWCEYERNFAFGISVENKENQIIPVMLSQCDFPGILKTLNYIDVPAGEDYAFKIRRCFDEDTRDFDHLVPELMKYCKNEKGPTNGTVARILGEKNLKYTCRGSAWSFRDLDQHQRYELRQLGSKFVERVYYEAKDIANTSAYMKYYSTIHSFRHCCGICCCGTTFCMLLILLIYFIVEVSDRKIVNGNFLLAVVLLIPFLGAGLVYVAHVQKYICDIIYGAREAGETFPERDRDREDKTRKAGKHFILSLIRRNYDLLFDNGFETSVVNRHPTLHKNKCICELLEKQVRQMYCNQI
ncbi:uncharacterized protein LOC124135158 isoform X2 [Haliotis rufescens]|uniref:uncharacterized protein LOC124135158 isoform X2 n=1 Tax=Haliotis rufescens TaxID=6454 RepID=UPI001EAF9ED6|nr:uncharacterized protein LOC124135158 isoform X2 [Haliotis rufescens]